MEVTVGQTCPSNWWVTITYSDRSALVNCKRLFRWAKRWSWLLLVTGHWLMLKPYSQHFCSSNKLPQRPLCMGGAIWNWVWLWSHVFPQSKFALQTSLRCFCTLTLILRYFPQHVIFKTVFSVWRCQKTGEWVTDQSTFTKRSPHPKNKKEFLRKMNVDVSGSWGVPISSKIFLQDG